MSRTLPHSLQQHCFAHTGILLPLFAVEKAAQRDGRRPHRHSLADVKDYLKESGTPHQQELAVRRPEAYPVEWEEGGDGGDASKGRLARECGDGSRVTRVSALLL